MLAALLVGCGEENTAAGASAPPPGVYGSPPAAESGWAEKYAAFVGENYALLSESCYGGVAGVGFIDLDLDGTPELVLFDSGASASMGVQLFDLREGRVVCVSASSRAVAEAFGGEALSAVSAEALYFEDFRLLRAADGRRWFELASKNGAEDFNFCHRIRFFGRDGLLRAESVCGRRLLTDPGSGETLSAEYTVGGQPAEEPAYLAAEEQAAAAGEDTLYEAAGAFIWADRRFGYDYDGLLAMLSAAVNAYVPVT